MNSELFSLFLFSFVSSTNDKNNEIEFASGVS